MVDDLLEIWEFIFRYRLQEIAAIFISILRCIPLPEICVELQYRFDIRSVHLFQLVQHPLLDSDEQLLLILIEVVELGSSFKKIKYNNTLSILIKSNELQTGLIVDVSSLRVLIQNVHEQAKSVINLTIFQHRFVRNYHQKIQSNIRINSEILIRLLDLLPKNQLRQIQDIRSIIRDICIRILLFILLFLHLHLRNNISDNCRK